MTTSSPPLPHGNISPSQAATELLRRRKARRGLLAFTEYTKSDYQTNWHHELICQALDRFVSGETKRLMIFTAPQHGKSELVSRRLPARIFGEHPDASIIACSYGADLASRMNRDVQRIIDAPEYGRLYPQTSLWGANVRTVADGSYLRNSDIFEIVGHRGSYRSAGVGGGITGMNFDYGIIDDPVKNREEAESRTTRNSIWEWYTDSFYTRQGKDASILLTLTRWHDDDLAGRLLKAAESDPGADQWEVLTLPAIAEAPLHPDDPRTEGEPLWPGRYGAEWLDATRINLGSYSWNAMYQQRPRPRDGGMFHRDWFALLPAAPAEGQRVRYWDKACLIAGTMVETATGPKPIEHIRRGEYVLTRQGYKRVEWSGCTGHRDDVITVPFANGQTITGTPDHRVWTENRGWVALEDITSSDYTLYITDDGDIWNRGRDRSGAQLPKPLSIRALSTRGGRVNATSQRTDGTRSASGTGRTSSTVPSGASIMAISRPGMRFITGMTTAITTSLRILSVSPRDRTSRITVSSLRGMGLRQRRLTMRSYKQPSGSAPPIEIMSADSAVTPSNPARLAVRPCTVPPYAVSGIGVPVYDLQVSEAHEFFANGVLVHNSTHAGGDYSAGVLMVKAGGLYVVEDVVRGQWSSGQRNIVMKQTAELDRQRYGNVVAIWGEQEPGSGGKESAENTVKELAGYRVRMETVTGSKETRADPFAAQAEAGNVRLVAAPWNREYLDELTSFPHGTHDDQVDGSSGAFNKLAAVVRMKAY